ncbi:family A G protein-coupled receptor-like protein [Parathielavia appendiculata]|uniref:Family A G protein-coupled receptor-like protein n=1 Tax=Parathielavia appendiculata TaxID=2587402 RepID=A0AAN6YZB4_9PEZI|nr:family A G protein-coupled receptor-like protein [Parathielavia appendiculata]
MIHPDQVAEMLYAAAKTTSKPGPIPTVIPTPTEYQYVDETGRRTLWVLFVAMTLVSAAFALLSWRVPVSKRVYHVTATLITIVSALAYFAMASGQASSLSCHTVRDRHSHDIPDTHHEVCRQIFWARYVNWALTTPLILLNLCLLAGVDGAHTVMAIIANVIMVLSGLFAAYGSEHTAQKWGWFVIACLGYVFAVWHVGLHGTNLVRTRGDRLQKLWTALATYSLAVLAAYPVVWAISTLARKTTVDTEIIIFAVLDVLSQAVFGFWLLTSHRAIAETNVDLGGYWSQGLGTEGRIRIGEDE